MEESTILPETQAAAILSRPNPFGSLFREITERARATLRRSAYCELREVSCDFSGGVLTLTGRVPSYHLKQLAQAAVADVPGVIAVDNHVEVA
jgi:osmotically-inducible protein OsmY